MAEVPQRPSQRPSQRPFQRPSQRPSQRPLQRRAERCECAGVVNHFRPLNRPPANGSQQIRGCETTAEFTLIYNRWEIVVSQSADAIWGRPDDSYRWNVAIVPSSVEPSALVAEPDAPHPIILD